MTVGGAPPPTDTPTPTFGLRPSTAHPASIKAPIAVSSNFFIIPPPPNSYDALSEVWQSLIAAHFQRHSRNAIGIPRQSQYLLPSPETAGTTKDFLLRNMLIIQPVPCLNLGSLLPGDPAQVLMLALP